MAGDASILVLSTAALLGVSVVFTALLRVGGIGAHAVGPGGYRGTAIVGGIVAGLLAGPGVLGQVNPELHRRAFVGGSAEARELEGLKQRQRADIAALERIGVTPVAIEEKRAEHKRERVPIIESIDEAESARRSSFDRIAAGFACVCVLSALICVVPVRAGARRRLFAGLRSEAVGVAFSSALYVLVGVGVPAVVTYLFASRDWRLAVGFGLVVGLIGVSGSMPTGRRWTALAALGLGWAVALVISPGWIAMSVTASGAAGVALGSMVGREWKRRLVWLARWVALPALSAMLAVRVDVVGVHHRPGFWYLLIAGVIWCSDGRWLAGWVALRRYVPRSRAWTRSSTLVDAGAGTATLVLALVFTGGGGGGGGGGEALVASALASAAVVELFRGFREFAGPVLDG